MFCSRDSFYKTPFGAVRTGEEVFFRLRLPAALRQARPFLELFPIGNAAGEPLLRRELTPEPVSAALSSPARSAAAPAAPDPDGDQALFSCRLTLENPGVLLYRFRLCGVPGEPLLSRGEAGRAFFGEGPMWQLTVYEPPAAPPEGFAGCVFYQIFPDRFCRSGPLPETLPEGRLLHGNWYEAPEDRPDANGDFPCRDYFGGNLDGILSQLPYLASLGVEALYLNPIFEAHSNHRYNTADYCKIDPLLGDEADFSRLCREAGKRGIRIVLDGVFNHTGSDSVYFNREGRYGKDTGAWRDPDSPFRDWFAWRDYDRREYDCWWGFTTLPDVREENPAYRAFVCGEDGVLRRWLRAGASGWRLDVADELPDSFIEEIRAAVKAEKPSALLLGEVWEDASNKYSGGAFRRYLLGRELDGVMNYPWRRSILDFVRYGKGQELCESIMTVLENYPPETVHHLLCSLSTHDVPRAVTALAAPEMGGHDRDWQRAHNTLSPEQYYLGRQRLMLCALIQFSLPGCPCIYYGDEAGLVGYADPFNRGTYPWGREDEGLLGFFRLLGPLRKNSPVLRRGIFVPLRFDERCCVFLRRLSGEADLLTAVNRSREPLPDPCAPALLEGAQELIHVGRVGADFSLDGHSGWIARLRGHCPL